MSTLNFNKQTLELVLSVCPLCGSANIIKHGTCSHHQRYLCKSCHHSFVSRFDSMTYYAKLKPYKIKFREKAFIDKLSLRSIADLFHVNKNTALLWRKKFLLVTYKSSINTKLFDQVEIDEKYVNVSKSMYKGTTKGKKFRGLSINKIALAIGCDNHNHHVFARLDRGHPSGYKQLLFWKDKIIKGSTLIHDADTSHHDLIEYLNLKDEYHKSTVKADNYTALQEVNNDCSFITLYLEQHPGIQNKNLNYYLAYLARLRTNGGLKTFKKWSDILVNDIMESKYRSRTAIFKNPSTLW